MIESFNLYSISVIVISAEMLFNFFLFFRNKDYLGALPCSISCLGTSILLTRIHKCGFQDIDFIIIPSIVLSCTLMSVGVYHRNKKISK